MDQIRQTQKKYCSRAMVTAIITAVILILAGQQSIGKGLIFGTIFSAINFVLIGETLPMKIGKARNKTFFISLGSVFFRFFLMAVPLIAALKFEQFNLFAVIAGLFSVQVAILAEHLFGYIFLINKKHI